MTLAYKCIRCGVEYDAFRAHACSADIPVSPEHDPFGRLPSDSGAKLDAGKNRLGLVLGDFSRALEQVGLVGTFGAAKYSDGGWVDVPEGVDRYTDAMLRHYMAEARGDAVDDQTKLLHAAHLAWNALARLDLMLRNG